MSQKNLGIKKNNFRKLHAKKNDKQINEIMSHLMLYNKNHNILFKNTFVPRFS